MMVAKYEDDMARELAHVGGTDPVRTVFGAAIVTVIEMLPDGFVRKAAIQELMAAEGRVRERLTRRVLN
jgi:hypothetical protein